MWFKRNIVFIGAFKVQHCAKTHNVCLPDTSNYVRDKNYSYVKILLDFLQPSVCCLYRYHILNNAKNLHINNLLHWLLRHSHTYVICKIYNKTLLQILLFIAVSILTYKSIMIRILYLIFKF